MPLTPDQISAVVNTLRCVPSEQMRRQAFQGMLPLLNLGEGEIGTEFDRVIGILRYLRCCDSDCASQSTSMIKRDDR